MLEGQFYIRLILNVIVGMMFAYALYKMAKHNNQETTPVPHKVMHVIGWFFIGLSILCLGVCIFYLTVVDFPQQLRVLLLDQIQLHDQPPLYFTGAIQLQSKIQH